MGARSLALLKGVSKPLGAFLPNPLTLATTTPKALRYLSPNPRSSIMSSGGLPSLRNTFAAAATLASAIRPLAIRPYAVATFTTASPCTTPR